MENKVKIDILGRINVYLLLALIFLIPSIFCLSGSIVDIFVLDKVLLFRVIVGLVSVLSLIRLYFVDKIHVVRDYKFWFILLCLIFIWLISTAGSLSPTVSWWGSYYFQQGVFSLLYYLLFFGLVMAIFPGLVGIRKLIWTMVLGSVIPCVYGLMQWLQLDPLVWSERSERILSTLGQPNFFGYYLLFVIPFVLYAMFRLAKHSWQRIFLALLFASQLWCLILTYSRGAWLGLMSMGAFFLVTWLWHSGRTRLLLRLVVVGLLLSVIILFNLSRISQQAELLADRVDNPVISRVLSYFYLDNGSNEVRWKYWQSAWSEMKIASWQRQVFGYGKETQDYIFSEYYQADWALQAEINYYPDRAHNILFDTWLEFGWLGVLAYLFFIGYILRLAWLKLRERENEIVDWLIMMLWITLAGQFVANLFSFGIAVHYVYWYLLLAMLWVLSGVDYKKVNINLSSIFRIVLIVVVSVFIAFFTYFITIRHYLADMSYAKALQSGTRKCDLMMNELAQAVEYYPFSVRYKNEYIRYGNRCVASIENGNERSKLIGNILDQVHSLDDYGQVSFTSLSYSAQTYSLLGYYIGNSYNVLAEYTYQQLLDHNQYISSTYLDYARMQLRLGNYEKAINIAEQGLANIADYNEKEVSLARTLIKEETLQLQEIIADVYFVDKQYGQALEYYKKIYTAFPGYLSIYRKIADTYYSMGNIEQTIAYNERGYRMDSANYMWSYNLAMLYKEVSNLEQAKFYAERALLIVPDNYNVQELNKEIYVE